MNPTPEQSDRMMSAACHVSSLVGFGFLAPLVIYLTQRERSGFVARHALQALFLQAFHVVSTLLILAVVILAGVLLFGITLDARGLSNGYAALSLSLVLLMVTGVFLPTFIYFVAMIVGVVECIQGKEAGLPLLGNLARAVHDKLASRRNWRRRRPTRGP